jgi:PTH1 family peptidyl-tRNA hydrolase
LADLRLIVGLGNPGKDYEGTRHNLGFLVVERLAEQYQLKISPSSLCKGLSAQGMIEDKECCLLFPLTYMNNSGIAVRSVVDKKEVSLDNILVAVDDFSLDFGQLRLRAKGSDGGHNGLGSIIAHLNSQDFARLRLGVGPVPDKKSTVDFVLEKFKTQERKQLDNFIKEAVDCIVAWLTGNSGEAMSQFNRKKGT